MLYSSNLYDSSFKLCSPLNLSLCFSPLSQQRKELCKPVEKAHYCLFSKIVLYTCRKNLWHGKIPGLPGEACSTKCTGVRVYGSQETFILKFLENAYKCLNNTFTNIKLLQIVCLILLIKIEIQGLPW